MLYAEVALPLHLSYSMVGGAWLLVLRRAQLEHRHAPPVAGFAALALHICAGSVYHFGALVAFTSGGGGAITSGGTADAATVANAAHGAWLLAWLTGVQFVQSVALYTAMSLLVLRMQGLRGSVGVVTFWGHFASVACVVCASVLVVALLCVVETDVRCTGCDFSAAHVAICCHIMLIVTMGLHVADSRV